MERYVILNHRVEVLEDRLRFLSESLVRDPDSVGHYRRAEIASLKWAVPLLRALVNEIKYRQLAEKGRRFLKGGDDDNEKTDG